MTRLAAGSCSLPKMSLEEMMPAYAKQGFTRFEAFTTWSASALDLEADPRQYTALAAQHGMTFCSMHLPEIREQDLDATLQRAIEAASFAKGIGAPIVLFKANSHAAYKSAAGTFLDAIEGLDITAVLQNHRGGAISSVEDFRDVLEGIDDPRMHSLLEVGQFIRAGEDWRRGFDLLSAKSTISLVHFRDMKDGKDVPFGEGDVDILDLFTRLRSAGYSGEFVIEIEIPDCDAIATLRQLREAREYSEKYLKAAGYE